MRRNALPRGVYPCEDGYVFINGSLQWYDRFCRMIDRPDLINDAEALAQIEHVEYGERLEALLYPWLLERTKQQVMADAQAVGLPVGAINTMADVFADPHFRAREFSPRSSTRGGRPRVPRLPFRMHGTPGALRRARSTASTPARCSSSASATPPRRSSSSASGTWSSGDGRADRGSPPPPRGGARALAGNRLGGAVRDARAGRPRRRGDRVESIQHLNPTRTTQRHLSPLMLAGTVCSYYVDRDPSEGFWNRQAWFNYGKRGCKSVTLDLARERGRELFYELVRHTDVFVGEQRRRCGGEPADRLADPVRDQPAPDHGALPGVRDQRPLRPLQGLRQHHGGGRRPHAAARLRGRGPLADALVPARRPRTPARRSRSPSRRRCGRGGAAVADSSSSWRRRRRSRST